MKERNGERKKNGAEGKEKKEGTRGRRYRIVKEPAVSDFHTNSRATGNHSKIKAIHHPRAPFYFAFSLNFTGVAILKFFTDSFTDRDVSAMGDTVTLIYGANFYVKATRICRILLIRVRSRIIK